MHSKVWQSFALVALISLLFPADALAYIDPGSGSLVFQTLIAALALYLLGSGPIRGFAVTYAIGIATTVFTAFTFTRLMIAFWYHRRRPSKIAL